MPTIFEIGTTVRIRAPRSSGHTRLPAYLAHKHGTVITCEGPFAFPEDIADGIRPPRLEMLYTIRFNAHDLWSDTTGNDVYAALYESYLEGGTTNERNT